MINEHVLLPGYVEFIRENPGLGYANCDSKMDAKQVFLARDFNQWKL
jgi:hypothetical protein